MKKVKDLPKVLRLMLFDLFKSVDICETDEAKIYLDAVKWETRTDVLRLAYCEVRYPKGTKIVCLSGHPDRITSSGEFIVHDTGRFKGFIYNVDKSAESKMNGVLYKYGKFAEIIEEVEESPVEFKEGEMVSPNFYEGLPENMWITSDPYFYIGRSKNGKICVEKRNGSTHWCFGVRKIDPDKELRLLAKEVLSTVKVDKDWVLNLENALIEMAKKVQSKK